MNILWWKPTCRQLTYSKLQAHMESNSGRPRTWKMSSYKLESTVDAKHISKVLMANARFFLERVRRKVKSFPLELQLFLAIQARYIRKNLVHFIHCSCELAMYGWYLVKVGKYAQAAEIRLWWFRARFRSALLRQRFMRDATVCYTGFFRMKISRRSKISFQVLKCLPGVHRAAP